MTDLHTYSEAACAECHPHPEHGGPCDLRPGALQQMEQLLSESIRADEDRKFHEALRKCLDVGPLDGFFPTGPLPGRRTFRLPRPANLIPPPRPPSCPHMELRSACALCLDKA